MSPTLAFEVYATELTRYARAVSTSEALADALVYCAFARMSEAGRSSERRSDARLALFKEFHAVWSSLAASAPCAAGSGPRTAWPPVEWAIFLLATSGEFSAEEVADVTGVPERHVEATLHRWARANAACGSFGVWPLGGTMPGRSAAEAHTSPNRTEGVVARVRVPSRGLA